MRLLNWPHVLVTSTSFSPRGGSSSSDWTRRPSTMNSTGTATTTPGHDRRPTPNGRNRKSFPVSSILAAGSPSKKRSGMNLLGCSQYLGLLAIHHEFTNTWCNDRGEPTNQPLVTDQPVEFQKQLAGSSRLLEVCRSILKNLWDISHKSTRGKQTRIKITTGNRFDLATLGF